MKISQNSRMSKGFAVVIREKQNNDYYQYETVRGVFLHFMQKNE